MRGRHLARSVREPRRRVKQLCRGVHPRPASAESSPTVTVSERPRFPSMSHLITSGSFPQLSSRRVNLSRSIRPCGPRLLDSERAWQAAVISDCYGQGGPVRPERASTCCPANFFPRAIPSSVSAAGLSVSWFPSWSSYPRRHGRSWVRKLLWAYRQGVTIDSSAHCFPSPSVGLLFWRGDQATDF